MMILSALAEESPQPLIPAEAGIQVLPNNENLPLSPFFLLLDSMAKPFASPDLRGNERSLG